MAAATLTDADIREIDHRIRHQGAIGRVQGEEPIPPAPGTWQHEAMVAQERKCEERVAAAKAREEEEIAAREAEEERRRREWEANAPKRAEAQAELEQIEAELAPVEERREDLRQRARELRAEASR